MEGLILLKEAEKKTGVKRETIWSWVRRGDVAGITGRPTLVHIGDLENFLMQRANLRLRRLYSKNANDVATAA